MERAYYQPIAQYGALRPEGAVTLAGGWCWFSHVAVRKRGAAPEVVSASDVPEEVLAQLCAQRAELAGLDLNAPRIMGILNVTPDSFSDGGDFSAVEDALAQARAMLAADVDMIDVGGESTRPGARLVPEAEEAARVAPPIRAIRAEMDVPVSIDTRKAAVAAAALDAGADLVNDVSGFTFDEGLAELCVERKAPVCIMHAQGDPATMQDAPHYDDVLLDVYDFLEARVEALEAQGIARSQMIIDPGIGFGKTQAHNLALLRGLSLFHGLACAILLGVSRKRFIGTIGRAEVAKDRAPGSIAVALAGVAHGVQILRVHDVNETRQALRLWQAATQEGQYDT